MKQGPVVFGQMGKQLLRKVSINKHPLGTSPTRRDKVQKALRLPIGQFALKVLRLSLLRPKQVQTGVRGNAAEPTGHRKFMHSAKLRHFDKCFRETNLDYFFDLLVALEISGGGPGDGAFVAVEDLFESRFVAGEHEFNKL